MDSVAEKLFKYLRDVVYDPESAVLDIESLPPDFKDFGNGLRYFTQYVIEAKKLAYTLSKGILAEELPSRGNEISAPLKSLHATLKHLTWQAKRIAQGDYNQRVDFMGEFSDAFNTMVEQLAERQKNLRKTIEQLQKKTTSLEQGNLLLNAMVHYVPQQVMVVDRDTKDIRLMNNAALNELNNDVNYVKNIVRIVADKRTNLDNGDEVDIIYKQDDTNRYFTVKLYALEWGDSNVEVFVIDDVSSTKKRMEMLEMQAYQDGMTGLYNRTFGMLMLNDWLYQNKQFVLVFLDLNSLKYVNDEFGHSEGDMYILNAAKHLRTFSSDALVCRIGGDEFMLLLENTSHDETRARVDVIYENFKNDEYLKNKQYTYSISYGIAVVEKDTEMSASDILAIADERMYEDKRAKKAKKAPSP